MKVLAAVRRSLTLLSKRDRRLYLLSVFAQMALSLLDLAGVLLLGLLGVVAAASVGDQELPSFLSGAIERVLDGPTPDPATVALWLGLAAATTLILKSVLAIFLQWRILRFLGSRTAAVAATIGTRFFNQPLLQVQKRPSSWLNFAFNEGVAGAIAGVLSSATIIFSELTLLVLLGGALLLISPLTTVGAVLYFGAFAFLMSRWLAGKSEAEGREQADSHIMTRTIVQDLVATYREISVLNRRDFFIDRFRTHRTRFAMSSARMLFIGVIPRYAMEGAMVLGTVLLTGAILLTQDVEASVGALFLFLGASARVMPALLRLSNAHIILRTNVAFTDRAFELTDELNAADVQAVVAEVENRGENRPTDEMLLDVELTDVDLQYPDRGEPALTQVSISIPTGRSVALVGPSGAGKSSLADVILGLVVPTRGRAEIGGLDPRVCIARYPGAIAYVPQNVSLVYGTIGENVALGIPDDEIDYDRVWEVLAQAHLADFVRAQTEALLTPVGERGVSLSGGQRQRLGIARALYSSPQLLVLDEATSALDAETEEAVGQTLRSLEGTVSIVTIAHRLATIRTVDSVVYMEDGRIVAQGTFDEVRRAVPDFEEQARLLGL